MAPHDLRRPFKRSAMSDQQKRRDLALLRQQQQRADSQNRARFLATSVLALQNSEHMDDSRPQTSDTLVTPIEEEEEEVQLVDEELNAVRASKLKGAEARRWFSRQIMLPEWMIDIPPRLSEDWYVFARPAGKRCFVVSSNGTTVSRLRNGSILHHFPSSLPNGARVKDASGASQGYSILDCIFHESDQTYYVIDMVCWRSYSLYDCTVEFRFFWLNSKLSESGACNPPSRFHKYRFSAVPVYNCNQEGLSAAYIGEVPYGKDGLAFYNKHAHYQAGVTPLALVWKDERCSQYFLDTDGKGLVPSQQQVALELQDDGKLITSDEPPMAFGLLDKELLQKLDLRPGSLLRFAIGNEGLRMLDGKIEAADLHFNGKVNRARAFADSYSKILFQYMARHSPLRFEDLVESTNASNSLKNEVEDIDMMDYRYGETQKRIPQSIFSGVSFHKRSGRKFGCRLSSVEGSDISIFGS